MSTSALPGGTNQAGIAIQRSLLTRAKTLVPLPIRALLSQRHPGQWPRVGWVRFGSLRRVRPISGIFGYDRGLPVDRYYIEAFLERHAADIKGQVLEVKDNTYTMRFGGDRVTGSEVLDLTGNQWSTIVGDLTLGAGIPSHSFDCIILTQVFQMIYDVKAAIQHCHRVLKPGGVVLATLPGISQISREDQQEGVSGDYWRFTVLGCRRLFEEVFPSTNIDIQTHGNVFSAAAFLYGLCAQELRPYELGYHDPDYQLIMTVRAHRQNSGQ